MENQALIYTGFGIAGLGVLCAPIGGAPAAILIMVGTAIIFCSIDFSATGRPTAIYREEDHYHVHHHHYPRQTYTEVQELTRVYPDGHTATGRHVRRLE